MHISLANIDPQFFFLRSVVLPGIGAVIQIAPRKQKHRWLPEERHLRSLLCRPDGEVLSSGLPKFFNLGEDASSDQLTAATIASGQAWFTEKLDGSLIIRDVLDGRVHLRTRGHHALPPGLGGRVWDLIAQDYPALLDPDVLPGRSLLLEYTSDHPEDRIIVAYRERRLTALGWMDTAATTGPPRFSGTPRDVAAMADRLGTAAVAMHALPPALERAVQEVADWTDREGVVVRSPLPDGGMHLAKLKSLRYLRNHTVRFHLTPARLATFCWVSGIRTPEALQLALHRQGADWEVFTTMVSAFQEYLSALQEAEAAVGAFREALATSGLVGQPMAAAVPQLQGLCSQTPAWKTLFPLGIQVLRGQDGEETERLAERLVGALALAVSPGRAQALREDDTLRARVCDLTPGLPDA